ncbi:hypothetical protein [Sphingobacterium tabacisoli]|uniref:Uncharacterized protein n=1 Tax=Sphingobacterium tabacisoli TaxID=2044855 RepID=A0ABW5L059_9SPHI|nr:hypothetical protein [Sphingobacterium tabacisoli]
MAIRYSELSHFFSRDKFTADELSIFIEKTSTKLSEKERDLLLILVKNQLSKFEKKKNQIPSNKPIASTKRGKHSESGHDLSFLSEFLYLSKEQLAEQLKISLKLLINVLSKHGIDSSSCDSVDMVSLIKIKSYIQDRLRFIRPKETNNIKRSKQITYAKDDAYGKLLTYGFSKVIYIRMK